MPTIHQLVRKGRLNLISTEIRDKRGPVRLHLRAAQRGVAHISV